MNIIPIFIPHIGCPCECVFCSQKSITNTLVAPTADDVRKTIIKSFSPEKKMQVAFYGGSFTAINKKYSEELLNTANEFIKSGNVTSIRVSTRPDFIDNEILNYLKEKNVSTIEIGAQSINDNVLTLSCRGHTAEDIKNAAKLIKSFGFNLVLQMMLGLPGESFETAKETVREFIRLRPDGVRIYPTVVIKNTALFEMWQNGSYTPLELDDAVAQSAYALNEFENAGINIIRVGLNPSDELSANVAAGAYHPAFGELVRSELIFSKIKNAALKGDFLKIYINKSNISAAIGQKKTNLERIKNELGYKKITFIPSDIGKNKIKLEAY